MFPRLMKDETLRRASLWMAEAPGRTFVEALAQEVTFLYATQRWQLPTLSFAYRLDGIAWLAEEG